MNKNTLKSIGAVLAGFFTVLVLSIVTDIIVEGIGIIPPATQPEAYLWWHLLIALIYRSLISVLGGFVTAKLAPAKPMKHVLTLAIIGTVIGGLGTMANWEMAVISGQWYPIALLLLSPLCIWYGGKLQTAKRS